MTLTNITSCLKRTAKSVKKQTNKKQQLRKHKKRKAEFLAVGTVVFWPAPGLKDTL